MASNSQAMTWELFQRFVYPTSPRKPRELQWKIFLMFAIFSRVKCEIVMDICRLAQVPTYKSRKVAMNSTEQFPTIYSFWPNFGRQNGRLFSLQYHSHLAFGNFVKEDMTSDTKTAKNLFTSKTL